MVVINGKQLDSTQELSVMLLFRRMIKEEEKEPECFRHEEYKEIYNLFGEGRQ